jgi:hypothetical protein
LSKAANERAEAYRLQIEWAWQLGVYGTGRPISFRGAANQLNERNIESPMGGRWTGDQLQRMALRLGLITRPATCDARSYALACGRTAERIRISAFWKKHPEFTAKRVIDQLGPGPFLTVNWVQKIMKECWRTSARHSPKQSLKGRRFYHSWRGRKPVATDRSRGS